MSDGRKALMASVTVLSKGFEVASETPRKTHAQNPTDSDRRETDYSDVPTDDHFDAIERAVPPSRFDDFEEL